MDAKLQRRIQRYGWDKAVDLYDLGFTNLNSFVRSDMGCWVYEQNNPLPHRPDR